MWPIKYKITWKSILLTLIGLMILFFLFEFLWPSRARSALPDNAKNIREDYFGAYLFPDYQRLLKAEVDSAGYKYFLNNLGLSKENCLMVDTDHMWGDRKGVEWWQPSGDGEGTVCVNGSTKRDFVVAKYEEGSLYFEARRY